MKRFALLTLLISLFALPTLAQSNLGATFTTDVGTTIDYPDDWTAELEDSLLIISRDEFSRVIVIDYPFASQIMQNGESLSDAIVAIADQILEEFETERIYNFDVLGREAARYDIEASPQTNPGAIVAVRFSNERVGMIIAININTATLDQMIESFDNTSPANDNAIVPSAGRSTPSNIPDAYLYQAGGRVIIPAGWSIAPALINSEIEYVTLQTADGSTHAIVLDLSNVVANTVALEQIATASGINLQDEFGVIFNTGEITRMDNRDVYRYQITVDGQSGIMVAVHFDDGGTGLIIIYGDMTTYRKDVNTLIGSFNNLGALINYLQ